MFIGRSEELGILEEKYRSARSELVVLYGRRRVGKSSLVQAFADTKPRFYSFEGIEGENTLSQLGLFRSRMSSYVQDPLLTKITFDTWETAFTYLTGHVLEHQDRSEKAILLLDEIQWMAAGRGKLISLIKYYWDNHWKKSNVMLVLCGSIATFMVQKIIRSKALYGRITVEMLLKGLKPPEALKIFRGKRSREEILKYLLVFGGVPKYLEEIDLNRSFEQNMERLWFSKTAIMVDEISKIFYSQFRDAVTYLAIVRQIRDKMCTLNDLSISLKRKSGGSLKTAIQNLVDAEIAGCLVPFGARGTTKFRKYRLSDEMLHFYFSYVEPNLHIIKAGLTKRLFNKITGSSIDVWLGFAFERFCIKNADLLSRIMGFEDEFLHAAPWFRKGDTGFKVDLMIERTDNVMVLCEIKYVNTPAGTRIIREVEERCKKVPIPRGFTLETALISVHGPDQSLRESGFFNHYVTIHELL